MPDLPPRKAGIVACSGEELAEGTVTRLAALKVLHELRPGNTVTICLPLFLAGGEGDRAFARFHPTITVDGCELRCAARGTEMYSGKPAASIVVTDLAAEQKLGRIEGRRCLNEAGQQAVNMTAQRLAEMVDQFVGKQDRRAAVAELVMPQPSKAMTGTCSCASGVPVTEILIGKETVRLQALPMIFQRFREIGRAPDTAGEDLLQTVKIYNYVPPEAEANYREAILREYAAFCARKE
ncbi:MAG: putative zinc-binding protein [Acidobacteriia bacterium]|nr:putative zinc-binding protein [Terriglobia bacterium]